MSANFQIEIKINNGNLHVSPKGDFDGSSASELLNLLHEKYDGKGEVVIDTHSLGEICPFGCDIFQCRLKKNWLPASKLIFKGEKGYSIAPEGSKVLVSPKGHKCRCNGRCENCACFVKNTKHN